MHSCVSFFPGKLDAFFNAFEMRCKIGKLQFLHYYQRVMNIYFLRRSVERAFCWTVSIARLAIKTDIGEPIAVCW